MRTCVGDAKWGKGWGAVWAMRWTVHRPWMCRLYSKWEWPKAGMATEWMVMWLVVIAEDVATRLTDWKWTNGGPAVIKSSPRSYGAPIVVHCVWLKAKR